MRVALRLAFALAVLSAPGGAAAQNALHASEEQLVNYAYATQLGSGVYDIAGRTLQVYRLPFGYTLTPPAGKRPAIRLTLPLTIGIVDFEPRDVIDTGLPEDLDTVSFVPGIELDFELSPQWHLLPFVEAGRTWDLGGGGDAVVYSLGVHAAALLSEEWVDLRFDIGATYAAIEPSAQTPSDDLLLAEVGIEGRHALGLEFSGHPLDWGAYLLGEAFGDRPEEPLDQAAARANRFQFEIGITFGTRAPASLWRIPIPRAGLGYRFGDDLGVWRLVIGAPF